MTNSLKIFIFSIIALVFSYAIINIFVIQLTILQFLSIEVINTFLTYLHQNFRKSLIIVK